MRSLVRAAFVLAAVLLLATPTLILEGYGTRTHATISYYAYNAATNIQNNFFNALGLTSQQQQQFTVVTETGAETHTGLGWVTAGSIREDTDTLPLIPFILPVEKPLFHFYDPHFARGLDYVPPLPFQSILNLLTASSSLDWATDISSSGNLALYSPLLCFLVPGCPTPTYTNSYSYSEARTYFSNGLTKASATDRNSALGLMFLSLGHTNHLLQDAAQPQHVRNDPHLEKDLPGLSYLNNPSAYERYVDTTYSSPSAPAWTQSPQQWASSYSPTSFGLPQDFFADALGLGLAEFTNANFVSAGTNCTTPLVNTCDSVGGYNMPIIDDFSAQSVYSLYGGTPQCNYALVGLLTQFPNLCTSDQITFFANQISDKYTGQVIQNDDMSTYSVFDLDLIAAGKSPVFSLNHFNYDAQANLLLPRAVGYSAGLLNYFFRGSMTAQGGPSGFTVTNNTMNGSAGEAMSGTFSFYYDYQDSTGSLIRSTVQGASWSLSCPAPAPPASGGTCTQMSGNPTLSFTPPTSPAPAQPGQYILVFQGTLGYEDGAVAGQVVQLNGLNLTVTEAGTGTGTVTSSPPGINCGGTCSGSFPTGTLTLTATPATGSTFGGWGGDCASAGMNATAVLTLTSAMTCTATFTLMPPSGFLYQVSCPTLNPGFVDEVEVFGIVSGPEGTIFSLSYEPSVFGLYMSGPPWSTLTNSSLENLTGGFSTANIIGGGEAAARQSVTVSLNGPQGLVATANVYCP